MLLLLMFSVPCILAAPTGFNENALFSNLSRSDFSTDDNSIHETSQNVVNIEIFGESMCPDTTRFMVRQFIPVWRQFGGLLNVTYHPFGVSRATQCDTNGNDFVCRCQHGERECILNQLQACLISALPNPVDHLEAVACIQSKGELSNALEQCLVNARPTPNVDISFLQRCATSSLGRRLMAQQGDIQNQKAPNLNWVPWIMINGRREQAAEKHLQTVICNNLAEPKPQQCRDISKR